LESVKNIIERGIQTENNKDIIINCFPIFKDNILRILIQESVQQREELPNIDLISEIFQKFMSIMDENQNQKFNEEILNLFINKNMTDSMDIDSDIEFNPLNVNKLILIYVSKRKKKCITNITLL